MFEDLEIKINQNNLDPNVQKSNPVPTPPPPSAPTNINSDLDKKSYIDSMKNFEANHIAKEASSTKSRKKFPIKIFVILIILIALGTGAFLFKNKISTIATGLINQVTTKFKKNTDTVSLAEPAIDNNIIDNNIIEDQAPVIEEEIIEEPVIIAFVDTDSDGLLDIYETIYGSDINQPDTDNDTYKDGEEVLNGYSPTGNEKLSDGKNIFYFAYGSNMNLDTMKSRCGEGNFVGFSGFSLNDYMFYFYDRGFANIRSSLSQTVKGVLYRINESCLNSLDQAEGYPNTYQRRIVKISNTLGNFDSWVYIVESDDSVGNPSQEYYDTVVRGAKQYGIDDSYIQYITSLSAQ